MGKIKIELTISYGDDKPKEEAAAKDEQPATAPATGSHHSAGTVGFA